MSAIMGSDVKMWPGASNRSGRRSPCRHPGVARWPLAKAPWKRHYEVFAAAVQLRFFILHMRHGPKGREHPVLGELSA